MKDKGGCRIEEIKDMFGNALKMAENTFDNKLEMLLGYWSTCKVSFSGSTWIFNTNLRLEQKCFPQKYLWIEVLFWAVFPIICI